MFERVKLVFVFPLSNICSGIWKKVPYTQLDPFLFWTRLKKLIETYSRSCKVCPVDKPYKSPLDLYSWCLFPRFHEKRLRLISLQDSPRVLDVIPFSLSFPIGQKLDASSDRSSACAVDVSNLFLNKRSQLHAVLKHVTKIRNSCLRIGNLSST